MSARSDIKIFIASSGELQEERKESVLLIAELNKRYPHLHLEPILFELDTPSGNVQFKERIQDGINPALEESHIAVIILYTKAGEFTLEELELALKWDKKVFVYLKEGFTPQSIEDLEKYKKVLELKAKMNAESAIRYQKYKTLVDYNGLLYKDLNKYLDETFPASANAPSATISTSQQHIPLAPRPYLAHPYAIVKNFTGRREEMTRLTEWYKYEKEPMCIVEAIGGMGKSALCWKWMQNEMAATEAKIEGIVWWSFYDQGFEDFIHHLYEYCIPETVRARPQRVDETTEVINALANHRFLLVLDGFERVLRGYAQMMAMYIQEEGLSKKDITDIKEAFDIRQRTPITPKAEKLLKALCAGNTKTLMTTRLYPATLEGLDGIKHIRLTGLSKTDTISFFKTEGIAGTDEEMIRAGEIYGFHPLMLKLLSTAIKRKFTKNIGKAFSGSFFTKALIDEKEPQKILRTSYRLLNPDEQKVASTVSVFRTAFAFDAAKALFPSMEVEKLEGVLMELYNLGFILYNEQQCLFDFHPILRSYLYDGLTSKDTIHQLAITYFTALPEKEKIVTLADLEPVIEQYHHLTKAEKYEEACKLYIDRLTRPLLFQLAEYELCINICKQLFIQNSDLVPQLKKKSERSFILNDLGICYTHTGQLIKATKNLLSTILIDYWADENESLGIGLANISKVIHIYSGKLSLATIHLVKSSVLLKKAGSFTKADNHCTLGGILTIRACYKATNEAETAESYLYKAMKYCTKEKQIGLAAYVASEYIKWTLAQINNQNNKNGLCAIAFSWSLKAIEYAEHYRVSSYPNVPYFLKAYEAISRTLVAIIPLKNSPPIETTDPVLFYDKHFQIITGAIFPKPGNYSVLAERCIHEGLTLSRKVNRVFEECTFSLLLAQMEWLKITEHQKGIGHFKEVEKIVTETHDLAKRIGYRMLLADLHLFCAEVLLYIKDSNSGHREKLLNYTAAEHLDKARDYARDTSDITDIFLPPDGSADEFYKDIPEYTMLKRGLTEEERIKNGYYAAWLRAEKLQQRL